MNTTTCFHCGQHFRDRDMMPLPTEGELCPQCWRKHEAFSLARATLRTAVKEYGWHRKPVYNLDGEAHRASYSYGPGKFEGEHWSIVHWHDAYMNGGADEDCGDFVLFTPERVERDAFGITGAYVVLQFSDNGFVSMGEWSPEQADKAREDSQE